MSLFEKHQASIQRAIQAIHERTFYAAFPELPKAYGEEATSKGSQAYNSFLNRNFDILKQGAISSWSGEEVSPYTKESLGIKYPIYSTEDLIGESVKAFETWKKLSPAERAGLLAESLEKIRNRFFEIAFATQHTTGQSWIMSFQASGPHAADRAMEAIAMGYYEQTRFPEHVLWEKPMGKFSIKLEKTFYPKAKGISVVIGCSTFPVWNSLPGMFASLVTGNPVIVKPHPKAILPIAICIAAMQETLTQNNYPATVVQLAADSSEHQIAKELATHPSVTLIDYTGNTTFGNYLESLPAKTVFTEKAGVNSVIIDSVNDLDAVLQNLAFSVSLYSGQMCTAPQNFFIPEKVKAGDTTYSFDEVAMKLKESINNLVTNPKMGAGVLGAIQSEKTMERVGNAGGIGGKLWMESVGVRHEEFGNSRTVSPVMLEAESDDRQLFENELFGPIVITIKTKNTDEAIRLAKELALEHGAITCAAYTTDDQVMSKIAEEMNDAFVPVSFNLTGPIWVNQHAAFSDFHVTGGNPAGNASFTNPEFVIKRFVWVGNRRMG